MLRDDYTSYYDSYNNVYEVWVTTQWSALQLLLQLALRKQQELASSKKCQKARLGFQFGKSGPFYLELFQKL